MAADLRLPLVSLSALLERGPLAPEAVGPSTQIRERNVLPFDFVLRRSLVNNGAGFVRSMIAAGPCFIPSD